MNWDYSSDIAAEQLSDLLNPCSSLFYLDLWRDLSEIH
jgi:hypothetical protein